MRNKLLFSLLFIFLYFSITAQEALKSTEEEYYDFLSLTGAAERPTLNYRTLSDSEWTITDDEQNIWRGNNLGTKRTLFSSSSGNENWLTRGIDKSIKMRLYGPEWFNSYNTAAPYGQNDGALWQGKGYNSSLTAGARVEGYGFELTVKPQVSFSENRKFVYTKPNYSGANYEGKAAKYGYYSVNSIDAPQRFGDSAFFKFDWGDTEARWSWNTFTLGFGTQAIWLGSAQLNPIIHSNNAAAYPKLDIGLRKTPIYFPHFGWHLGDIELRGWWGMLTESDYFDNDDSNDNNLISGLSAAYRFPFTNLSLGVNRTMLSKWNDIGSYSLFHIFLPFDNSGGSDNSDQRFSVTSDWLFTKIGLEIYLEWGRNDYSPSLNYIIRYPFHTQGWTVGMRKSFTFTEKLKGEILLELTNLESSRDYELLWGTTFYAHHIITQGYTNKGQWLGAGMGTGGNSQYLGAKLCTKKSSYLLFMQRENTSLDYTWFVQDKEKDRERSISANLSAGVRCTHFMFDNLMITSSFVYIGMFNPLNDHDAEENYWNNFHIELGLKYTL